MNSTARPARTTAENLQHILNHWDHLRDALDTTGPGGTWPPSRPGADYLRALDQQDAADVSAEQSLAAAIAHAVHHPQRLVTTRHHTGQLYYRCAFCEHVGEGLPHPVRPDRDPAQLGERPIPIRLHITDASRAIEIALCTLADSIAVRDAVDPADWHQGNRGQRTAPTAAAWLLGRLGAGPCCATHDADRARIDTYAREAAARLDRVLGTGRTSRVLPGMPCPWCAGDLVMHTEAGTVTSVTCATGLIDCSAPVPFDIELRARVWSSVEHLAALQRALDAAERKRAEAEQRARRTEDRRRQRAAARDRAAAA
ncbi:hypothetical protein EES45_23060 [Streptomyces sp. ADI97-07]|uniref:hypothetical protein n=1 Tax=Streptomyces sp. ADI97-07 TaxID=1522762 RepID=UPI000F54F359|nr:hypothetical protein [Streptomyces sp. ADI97-07]RPK76374.1 hypothetical protein EES45_23060 [Streptomyces sp. ADI97-07]